jgi:hypothetical protein
MSALSGKADIASESQYPGGKSVHSRRESMRVIHRIALATFMGFALTVAIASYSIAQQQQLIGTWLLVSEITEFPDGKRLEGFGGNQKGMLIFDRAGHYSSQLTGASRIKIRVHSTSRNA